MEKIWIPRCNLIHEKETRLNISKITKRLYRQNNRNIVRPNISLSHIDNINNYTNNIDFNLDSIRDKIYFGQNLLGFILHVNYVSVNNF